MSRRVPRLLLAATVAVGLAASAAPAQASSSACTAYASPAGSDAAAGTAAAPFGTVQRLIDTLGPGQTGCLADGVYDKRNGDYVAAFERAGTAAAPITLRSAPGQHAELVGIVEIRSGAAYTTLSDLAITGTGAQNTVKVYSANAVIEDSEITNEHRGPSCLLLGSSSAGTARDVTVRRNVLRACGSTANGNKDHGIYASVVRGGTITDNVISDPTAWAIQFYPDTQGLTFSHNVIDGGKSIRGGIVFGGTSASASSGNVVEHNVIANASTYGLAGSWGGARGTGNVARDNCLFAAPMGEADGFASTRNVVADPRFVDGGAGDFRLGQGTACLATVGYDTVARILAAKQSATPAQDPATTTPVSDTPQAPPATSTPAPTAAAAAVGAAPAPATPAADHAAPAPTATPAAAPPVRVTARWKGSQLRLGVKLASDVKAAKVAFKVGGKVRAVSTRAPYRAVWNAPVVRTARAQRIEATVYDRSGRKVASASVPSSNL